MGGIWWAALDSNQGTLRAAPAVVAGRCESAKPSQTAALNLLGSHCERLSGTVRIGESVPAAHPENARKGLGLRSQTTLVATPRRDSVIRSPRGEIRGGFAVSPKKSERFARRAGGDVALARASRQRRKSSMSDAWDSSPSLCPVPWGERIPEASNCVPVVHQSAPLINSAGVREKIEAVDHRGPGASAATNGPNFGGVARRRRVRRGSAPTLASAAC